MTGPPRPAPMAGNQPFQLERCWKHRGKAKWRICAPLERLEGFQLHFALRRCAGAQVRVRSKLRITFPTLPFLSKDLDYNRLSSCLAKQNRRKGCYSKLPLLFRRRKDTVVALGDGPRLCGHPFTRPRVAGPCRPIGAPLSQPSGHNMLSTAGYGGFAPTLRNQSKTRRCWLADRRRASGDLTHTAGLQAPNGGFDRNPP